MKGIKYKLPVVESILSWSHGSYLFVEEIFIPSLGIAFNEKAFAFKTTEERYKPLELPSGEKIEVEKVCEVEIPEKDLKILENYILAKENLEEFVQRYFQKNKV
jgi:hypothetical protein